MIIQAFYPHAQEPDLGERSVSGINKKDARTTGA
jgi:hypothetical protein